MAIDDITRDEEELMKLAREKQGFYKGKGGYYLGTADRGDDALLLQFDVVARAGIFGYRWGNHSSKYDLGKGRAEVSFWVDELGYPGLELLDLFILQTHDILAGPFEDRQTAIETLPYVIKVRYLEEYK